MPHTEPDCFLAGGPSNAGGLFVNWALRTLGARVAGRAPARPDRVPVWAPYPRGERVPLHDADRRGVARRPRPHPRRRRAPARRVRGVGLRRPPDDRRGRAPRTASRRGGSSRPAAARGSTSGCRRSPTAPACRCECTAVPEGAALGWPTWPAARPGLEPGAMTTDARRWARAGRTVEPDPAWAEAAGEPIPAVPATLSAVTGLRDARRQQTSGRPEHDHACSAMRAVRSDGAVQRGGGRRPRSVPRVLEQAARDSPSPLMEDGSYEIFPYDLVSAAMRDNVTLPSGSHPRVHERGDGPVPARRDGRARAPAAAQPRRAGVPPAHARALGPGRRDPRRRRDDRRLRRRAAQAELVSEFTYHYPAQVIAEILGLPRADHEYFHPRALAVINVAVRPEEGIVASEELRDYFAGFMDERRANPGTDIISELVQAELDGEVLGDEEIFSFLRLLLPAGAETTYRATGSFLYGLLTNPDQLDALRADRSRSCRRRSRSRSGGRARCSSRRASAAADTEIGGVAIPKGGDGRRERRLGEPRRDPLGRTRRVRHLPHAAAAHRVRRTACTCASGCTSPAWRCRRGEPAARPVPEPAASIPDRWDADDVHIHGERFRSPTTLPVLFDA